MAVCIQAERFDDENQSHLSYGNQLSYSGELITNEAGQSHQPIMMGSSQGCWPNTMPIDIAQLGAFTWQSQQQPSQDGGSVNEAPAGLLPDYITSVSEASAGGSKLASQQQEWVDAGLSWQPHGLPPNDAEWRGCPPCPPSISRDQLTAGGQRAKRRFCTAYPDVAMCRRGTQCTFAHTREEIDAPLLDVSEENQEPTALTDEFFMYKYKTRWCPIGVPHEWHTCVYAHNYQDARRPVSTGYGARLCPYWSKKDTGAEYSQRCPLGLRCPYAHGAKEQLYHPHYFKTIICRDLRGKVCPRQSLCAFFHHRGERRATPTDAIDYSQPLRNEALPVDWVADFLTPPFLGEGGRGAANEPNGGDGIGTPMGNVKMFDGQGQSENGQVPYGQPQQQANNGGCQQQQQCVTMMPMQGMMPQGSNGNGQVGSMQTMQAMQPMLSPQGGAAQGMPQHWMLVPVLVPVDGSGSPSF